MKFQINYVQGNNSICTPQHIQDELSQNIESYKRSSCLLTSCWTLKETESVLMWDRWEYSKACIKTTIGNFVSSFIDLDLYIWCGDIEYRAFDQVCSYKDKLWYKEPSFSDEQELRFYFSKNLDNIVPDINAIGNGYSFKVIPFVLIDEIILSPYIDKNVALSICKMIKERYGIQRVVQSRIMV